MKTEILVLEFGDTYLLHIVYFLEGGVKKSENLAYVVYGWSLTK